MKIATVVGARPQFIKAAVVSHALDNSFDEVLIHTGQHFDHNMSGCFFDELDIQAPKYNLGISGGTHSQMTGKMMMEIERVMIDEKPDLVLVYGDTNSTLAAALASAKLHIPICHVEAGARTHCMTNPEEINRVCTDHVSSLLLASTQSGMDELKREGLFEKASLVGDPMYDAFVKFSKNMDVDDVELVSLTSGKRLDVPVSYFYLTCHREENTQEEKLYEILDALNSQNYPTIYPVHPRNRKMVISMMENHPFENILLVEPLGYFESICLVKNSTGVVTDSGGLQREAFFAKRKCVTILDFVVWPETMRGGCNVLSSPQKAEIISKLEMTPKFDVSYQPFGDGHAAERIVDEIKKRFM